MAWKCKKKKKNYLALCKKVCSLHLVFCSSSYTFTYSFFPASFILSAKCSRRINSFPSTSLKFIHSIPFVLLIILKFYNAYCFVSKLFNVLSWVRAQSCLTLCNPMDCSHQAPLSVEFFRQEYWRGLPFPTSDLMY